MNRFLEEWVGANFNHGGEILHSTKEAKKLCYDRNNARNRDIYSRKKTQGKLIVFSELSGNEDHYDFEEKAISSVDSEKQQQVKQKPQ